MAQQPMQKVVADNKLPIIVSLTALVIAVFVGLVPVWQQNQREAARAPSSGTVALVDLEGLSDRIAALEAAAAAAPQPAQTAPQEMDPALRAEIDLIVKGLVNQTGRVSRLQDAVESLQAVSGQVPPVVSDEISLAKRGLVNLTRRINTMQDRLEPLAPMPASVDRLGVQMSNVERAVTRLNLKLKEVREAPAADPMAVDRLGVQMSTVERAVTRLNLKLNEVSSALNATSTDDGGQDLSEITDQLEAILAKISEL